MPGRSDSQNFKSKSAYCSEDIHSRTLETVIYLSHTRIKVTWTAKDCLGANKRREMHIVAKRCTGSGQMAENGDCERQMTDIASAPNAYA